ncbi:MAG TPA: heavy metal translocating P-type ATPase [Rhodothermales bacterium]|nr:heavy metal translocating P-type ATPase [Rhodothermales bacterium]
MEKTVQFDLAELLPEVPDAHDACVDRLVRSIESKEGVIRAHVEEPPGGPARLCLHYDPERLPLPRVRELALQVGTALGARYGHLTLTAGPMQQRRARTLTELARRLPGVLEAGGSGSGVFRVEFDRQATGEEELRRALAGIGLRGTTTVREASAAPAPHDHAGHDHTGHDHAGHEGHEHGEHDHKEHEHKGHDHAGHDHAGHDHGGHGHTHSPGEAKLELTFALLSGACLLVAWLLGYLAPGVPDVARTALYGAAVFFGGAFTLREAVAALRAGQFEIDFLMLVAAAGAVALGEWADAALLLFLFSTGHALEGYAMGRARRAIEALGEIAPKTALVKRDGGEVEVPVEELRVGETVVVRPNSRIPADGVVVDGESPVNQAPITGESVPVDKRPAPAEAPFRTDLARWDTVPAEHRAFAGTINGAGALEVLVARAAADNTLARVVELVAEAQTQKSPTQQFTDRFERVFVPSVLVFVGLLLVVPPLLLDEPFAASFYRAMAVLVAASPCALAIATPSAVLSGVARAARGGVLIKGGAHLEALGALRAMAFDKTGTLTEGKPKLTDVVPAEGVTEQELLRVAVAVERRSDHPLAAAVVREGTPRLAGAALPEAGDLRAITARGVESEVEGRPVHVGNAALFGEAAGTPLPDAVRAAEEGLRKGGRSTMIVRHGDRYLGVLGLMDTPRADAKAVLARLKALGIERTIMLTGDNQAVADAVARELGLTEARGDLLPEDKVTFVRELAASADHVAMVGDGVNDAPALANATVGIAMGAGSSDVALETADVALMGDRLDALPFAVGLSRAARGVIRQNLVVSLGMVAILIPSTLLGLNLGLAVLFHEGSTLVVVANALRLLAYRKEE